MKRSPSGVLPALLALLLAMALSPSQAFSLVEELSSESADTALSAQGDVLAPQATVETSYLELDGSTKTVKAREVSTSMQRLDAGWWVMRGGMKTATQRIDVAGEVNLILAKDAYFCADAGINIMPGAKLTIWGETANAGQLIAITEWYSAIGGNPGEMGGELIINGGKITASGGKSSAGIGGSENGGLKSVTINGGVIDAQGWKSERDPVSHWGFSGAGIGSGNKGKPFPITINDGIVTAEGGDYSSGIGGGRYSTGGGVYINGGNVTAKGGKWAAGIGGGEEANSGGITIAGGKVEARGGEYGSGIGGGWRGSADGLTFNGGEVTAISGHRGAGIGGGYDGNATQLWFNGGTVVAKSTQHPTYQHGFSGAGIGGGYRGDFKGEMIVTGGDITAIAARGSAGIGAGCRANMTGTLTVKGGTVRAYGGGSIKDNWQTLKRGSAGIGGGEECETNTGGEGGTVNIEGGTVIACAGGAWNRAIGAGYNDRVLGTVSFADNLWVQWTNDVTPGAMQADLTYAEPTIAEGTLKGSWVANRASDCQNMRYVKIEVCPHPADVITDGRKPYLDTSPEQHYINFRCPYCKVHETGTRESHNFNSGKDEHTCVCGHQEHNAVFYTEETAGAQPYSVGPFQADGLKVTKPTDPTKEGSTFAGWYEKDADGALKAEPYNFNESVSRNLTLYAKWIGTTQDTCTVKFHHEGTGAGDEEERTVTKGKRLTVIPSPGNPPWEGQVFVGWYQKAGSKFFANPFDFTQPITADVSLFEKWESKVTVTFESNGGTEVPSQTFASGGRIVPIADAFALPPADQMARRSKARQGLGRQGLR